MILRVNPNRMELFRLRRRLALALRGHKLLQDKLEEMMRKFLALLKDIDKEKEGFQRQTKGLIGNLLYSRIVSSRRDYDKSLSRINSEIEIKVSTAKIMNVAVPLFSVEKFRIEKNYDFFQTSAQMDVAIAQARDYLQSLLRLAQLFKSLEILSYEIERTRRRVNALEYILIPSIHDTIRYISQKLNEFERANLVRLMRVKELVEK